MTKKLTKFYKGICLCLIHKELIKTNAYSLSEVDEFLKYRAGLNKSCQEMTKDELNELIIECFRVADEIGIELNFPNNECEFIREL